MAGNQTGIIGLADDSTDQRGHSLPGARGAKPGPIGLLAEDADDALQAKPGAPVPSSQIQVKVTTDGATPIIDLKCTVTVGSSGPKIITTNKQGFLVSSDQSAGAVTIEVPGKLIKLSSSATPAATLAVSPKPPTRGDAGTITITQPPGVVGFKVTEWSYNISHTNPGSSSASTATVTRPTTENASTFDQQWQGVLCASGKAIAKFIVGASVRDTGDTPVNATVTALDPVEASLDITVSNRTSINSTLTENTEQALQVAINGLFENLGKHKWDFTAPSTNAIQFAPPINSGPNKGCKFVSSFTGSFISTPQINTELTNAGSAFSQAQDKAYLMTVSGNDLNPARVIPRNLYDIKPNSKGAIQIKDENAFRIALGLKSTDSFAVTGHCITQSALLAGTRRHESGDPDRSHKANCLKARRALDPGVFSEALVQMPGATLDFGTLIQTRTRLVSSAGSTHDVVDESASKAGQDLKFVSGKTIPDVNMDAQDKTIGPVWDPTTNAQLT